MAIQLEAARAKWAFFDVHDNERVKLVIFLSRSRRHTLFLQVYYDNQFINVECTKKRTNRTWHSDEGVDICDLMQLKGGT